MTDPTSPSGASDALSPTTDPVAGPLLDTFGRVHRDLRVSVTDRCSFRCTYCMPAEGMTWLPRDELLTFEEIERVVALLVRHAGITSVRLTGGEPTVRAHLPVLVAKLSALGVEVAMTTNGATLALVVDDLVRAGLTRVNVSLDSLDRDRFAAITRRDALPAVLEGIAAARDAGLSPVKVNCVVVRGVNDDEVEDLAAWARDEGVTLRLIETMPLDAGHTWTEAGVVPRDELVARLDARFGLVAVPGPRDEPAERFAYADGRGEVGIIPSVTHAFCDTCDRVRLTAEGALRTCLFASDDHDLRPLLRGGVDDAVLLAAVRAAMFTKAAGHGIGTPVFVQPRRGMSQIGG